MVESARAARCASNNSYRQESQGQPDEILSIATDSRAEVMSDVIGKMWSSSWVAIRPRQTSRQRQRTPR